MQGKLEIKNGGHTGSGYNTKYISVCRQGI